MAAQALSRGALRCVTLPRFPRASSRRLGWRCMASAQEPQHHVLHYEYVPDILEKRGPYRAGHLGAAKEKLENGKLVMGGACGDPVDGALFIFKASTKQEIEEYVAADPYVQNGLVTKWSIKPYIVAVGP
ncbi:hypothetical protein BSKO_11310 [Bryopsis sp. KO-2023]|nr:hypothetical protein BSKO_11310 [Bryopsis sp. KO-2023]